MIKRSKSSQRHSQLCVESLEQRRMLTTIDLFPSQDTTLYVDPINESANGAGERMVVGNTNQGLARRGLLKFDIAGQIPWDAAINDVRLTLQVDKTEAGAEEISLHPVLSDWGEGTSAAPADKGGVGAAATLNSATWNFRSYPHERWDEAGGDYKSTAQASTVVEGAGQYEFFSFRMIDQVTRWLVHPEDNFGWMLIGNESGQQTTKRFGTRESSIRPVLTVDFDPSNFPQVTIEGTSRAEGDTSDAGLPFVVTVSREITEPIVINYETVSDTAVEGEDYERAAGQLIFNPGDPLTQEIRVSVRGDLQNEVDESFSVVLSGPAETYDILTSTAVATIENDDPLPKVSVDSIRVVEGDEGTTLAELSFSLSEASGRDVSLQYVSRPETAEFNLDYNRGSGQVNFAPGELTQRATINILGDVEQEADETFTVVLANANHVELEVASVQVTILNDDFSNDAPWKNDALPEDTTADGIVSPLDALVIINNLNEFGARRLTPPDAEHKPPPFIDVNGDSFVAPLDALLVINYLNNPPTAAVQATFATEPTSGITAAHAAAVFAEMDDLEAEEKRRRLGESWGEA